MGATHELLFALPGLENNRLWRSLRRVEQSARWR